MNLLENKLVLITGGSLGIGLACAKKCAREGARLILCARTEKHLRKAVAELDRIDPSKEHFYRVMDVGSEPEVKKSAQWVKAKFKALDGLVNCAAVIGSIGPLNEVKMSEFVEAVRINFLGTVFMCHYFAPMMKNRGAKIVNFSGGGGTGPFPNYSAYGAGKAAVVRLTENLAEEFKPLGIEVNSVSPGFVATRIHDKTFKAGKKAGWMLEYARENIKKGGVPAEKGADLTAFLLSGKSEGINGKALSAAWDPWESPEFAAKARQDKDFATLRRIDGMNFFGRNP